MWDKDTAEKYNITINQLILIWKVGQLNEAVPRDARNTKWFTDNGLTIDGQQIYQEAELARREHISNQLKDLLENFTK